MRMMEATKDKIVNTVLGVFIGWVGTTLFSRWWRKRSKTSQAAIDVATARASGSEIGAAEPPSAAAAAALQAGEVVQRPDWMRSQFRRYCQSQSAQKSEGAVEGGGGGGGSDGDGDVYVEQSSPSIIPWVDSGEYDLNTSKMMMVVRRDLKMTHGKKAAQCGHAVWGVAAPLMFGSSQERALLEAWMYNAQPKVAVRIDSQEGMFELRDRCRQMRIPYHVVRDAGKTQIPPGSRTVLALLAPAKLADQVTGNLKLY